MLKSDLREHGYSAIEKRPKEYVVTILWIILTILLLGITFIIFVVFIEPKPATSGSSSPMPMDVSFGSNSISLYVFTFFIFFFSYFALKLITTIIFCFNKEKSIKLKILEGKGLPICLCKEALKVWQTVLIYLIPIIIVYIPMFIISCNINNIAIENGVLIIVNEGINAESLFMLLFISFFMAFDLTLVIYVLFLRIKEKIDFISIEFHIYGLTIYKETYVKLTNKKARELYNKEKRTSDSFEKKPSPKMFKRMMKCDSVECENYGKELDENTTVCPSCGEPTGKFALVFTGALTCINPRCEYYNEELKDNPEICPSCALPTGNLAFKVKDYLAMPAIIIALSSIILYALINWAIFDIDSPIVSIVFIVKFVISIISISMSISSKSKTAIFITFMALIANLIISFVQSAIL
jgi:hypothetical protein